MTIDRHPPVSLDLPRPKNVLVEVFAAMGKDRVSLLAAGVAFYIMFAIFPALGAATWIFGLLADPHFIEQQLDSVRDVVPAEGYKLIETQLRFLTSKSTGLSFAGIISLLVALYSARTAASSMIEALNAVYKVEETRGFFKVQAIAILCTIVAIVVFVLAIGLLVVVPALFTFIDIPPLIVDLVRYLRWPGLAALVALSLALSYRYAPNRSKSRWRLIGWGSVTATAMWLLASFGFSWYVAAFGSYNRVYGSLGAVVILLFWFWLTAFIALLGAELDKAIEDQTSAAHG